MVALGIDPGSIVTGFGLIETQPYITCIEYGCIRSKSKSDFSLRLKTIYDGISDLIQKYNPDSIAFEDIFYGHNVKSAIQLGHARGAAIVSAVNANVELSFYSPREVKLAVTGYGNASKEQVQKMVQNLLRLEEPVLPLDASDALAVALCHLFRTKSGQVPQ